jgi:hypothetical protein
MPKLTSAEEWCKCGRCRGDKVSPGWCSAHKYRAAQREALEFAATLWEDGECLPKCNSFMHEPLCPVADFRAALLDEIGGK